MNNAFWRIVIAVATAVLIAVTFAMILLTSPQLLAGVESAESVELVIVPISCESAGSLAPVNINTASAEQLQSIPGIGEVLADRIVKYREVNGPFSSLEELAAVDGIGDGRIEKWRDRLVLY